MRLPRVVDRPDHLLHAVLVGRLSTRQRRDLRRYNLDEILEIHQVCNKSNELTQVLKQLKLL